ncbi:hypothetical protein M9H77_35409 [Catharanthus roseus]|uniref:Uncharacterized protein n=1 Tax=Catharanthus roseus TaxID=4058 RepID=A0ACB9ZPU9_CATRO|nr:hypothetical protein M9H77_35409 [Catharanthus roseus]
MGRFGRVLIIFVLLFVQLGFISSRVLKSEEELMKKMHNIRLQALPKGDVPPSGPSGCTYIPGSGGSGCPINARHYAGSALPRATTAVYPPLTVSFGVATNEK